MNFHKPNISLNFLLLLVTLLWVAASSEIDIKHSEEYPATHNNLNDSTCRELDEQAQIRLSEQQTHANENREVTKNTVQASLVIPGQNKTVELQWPATGPITSEFGARNGHFHAGIDITQGKSRLVRAAADGIVVFADWNGKLGRTIIIDHSNGVKTVYSHNARLYVARGMRVKKGKRIAYMGSSGKSTGVHLHFEVHINGEPQNPVSYLRER